MTAFIKAIINYNWQQYLVTYVIKEGLVLRVGVGSCVGERGRRLWRRVADERRARHEPARALRERTERGRQARAPRASRSPRARPRAAACHTSAHAARRLRGLRLLPYKICKRFVECRFIVWRCDNSRLEHYSMRRFAMKHKICLFCEMLSYRHCSRN